MEKLSLKMQASSIEQRQSRIIRRAITSSQVVKDAAEEWSYSLLGKLITKDTLNHENVKREVNMNAG